MYMTINASNKTEEYIIMIIYEYIWNIYKKIKLCLIFMILCIYCIEYMFWYIRKI